MQNIQRFFINFYFINRIIYQNLLNKDTKRSLLKKEKTCEIND